MKIKFSFLSMSKILYLVVQGKFTIFGHFAAKYMVTRFILKEKVRSYNKILRNQEYRHVVRSWNEKGPYWVEKEYLTLCLFYNRNLDALILWQIDAPNVFTRKQS